MAGSVGKAIGTALAFTPVTGFGAIGGGGLVGTAEGKGPVAKGPYGIDFAGDDGAPATGVAPTAPNMTDAAKQAQLDEQKRQSMTGPSDITNTHGAKGILTDPNAKYVTGKLLGGA